MIKKYIPFLFSLSLIIFFSWSCSKKDKNIDIPVGAQDPIASFSFTGNDGPAPVSVSFSNTSETINADSVSYLWTFGKNGPTSTEKNPVQVFYNNTSNSKLFLITLQVHDLISDRYQRRSLTLTVLPAN